jgi:hypothetical protein
LGGLRPIAVAKSHFRKGGADLRVVTLEFGHS